MSAVLLAGASFAAGLFVGVVVGTTTKLAAEYQADSRDRSADRDQLVRTWREGYANGFTTGRIQLLDEQRAQRHHPTAHPLAEVVRLERRNDE
ncbi:MAG: hypothetical protein ACKO04_03935, partial [Actinomycetes bacterium]